MDMDQSAHSRSSTPPKSAHTHSDMADAAAAREKEQRIAVGGDEERDVGIAGTAPTEKDIETLSRRGSNAPSRDSQLRRTGSHHSRAGPDGYTWHDHDAAPRKPIEDAAAERSFVVAFDGDADPECPRSMSKLRRWMIVLICATSSLCV